MSKTGVEVETDPQLERRTRRRFSAAEKQRLLSESEPLAHGESHARPCPRPRLTKARLANHSANGPNCAPLMEASVQSNADRAASRSALRQARPSGLHLPRAVPGAEACAIRPSARMKHGMAFGPNSV